MLFRSEVISRVPHLGKFMAYEVVCDLYHTPVLDRAPDIMTWANPGPGAKRGVRRILFGSAEKTGVRVPYLEAMRALLPLVKTQWSYPDNPWDMRTVEHTLCEYDKYERARLGEGTPKQRYRPHGTS